MHKGARASPCLHSHPTAHSQEQKRQLGEGGRRGRGCVSSSGFTALWVPVYSGCRAHPPQPIIVQTALQELSSQTIALPLIQMLSEFLIGYSKANVLLPARHRAHFQKGKQLLTESVTCLLRDLMVLISELFYSLL